MRRVISAVLSMVAVIVGGFMFVGDDTRAQSISNSTYAAVPPFVSGNTIPNIIVLMDNSGSMAIRGCESSSCGLLPNGSPSTTLDFTATTSYSGFFDNMACYTYDSGNTRFVVSGAAKAALNTPCASTLWDGNILNWITLRRFDAIQIALMGGVCAVARAADGTCPASGSPALKTVKGLTIFDRTDRGHDTTATEPVPLVGGSADVRHVGRVPTVVAQGATNLYFHLRGGQSGMQGTFCIDNDATPPGTTANSCSDGSDGFNEGITGTDNGPGFVVRVAVASEPQGVIQQVGSQARFGLMVFSSTFEGGQMLVGVGSRQSLDYAGTTVETFNTNTAAMIDAIEEAFPNTWTPLAEALYDAIAYTAQINSPFSKASAMNGYAFPLAYSPGTSMGGSINVGRIGSSEITALVGSETCPSGYITNACGRDPYFFGSNHSPAWASPSTQVTCCQTFILVLTDGEPTEDRNTGIPSAVRDYAHAHHGQHCKDTGASPTIHAPNGVCNTNAATPPSTLLGEHKIGDWDSPPGSGTGYPNNGSHWLDDVAFWGHTVDLRQATIPVINVSGRDISGTQNVTVYSFFAFGNISGREILMQTAKMGGFDDVNANGLPDAGEWDKVNNVTGASGADGVPDTYFESSNVDELKNKLTATFSSILQRSTSGTSLSVLATSTTGEGALYQSFFFPKVTENLVNVYWIGYTQSLFLDTFGNLREDTNGDGRLVYKEDMIIRTRYDGTTGEVKADLYADTSPSPDGDGLADNPATPTSTVALKDIKPVWEAGKKLALRDDTSNPRNILTWLDLNGDGLVNSGEETTFATANESNLRPYLRAASSTEGSNIINWVRGRIVSGYRNRELTVSGSTKTWKYGDTIHSTPTVVGAPRERTDIVYGDISYSDFFKQYRSRRQVAYVGGNDGMLHAFNVGFYNPGDDPSTTTKVEHGWFTTQRLVAPFVTNTPALGEELWAFVPQNLLPQLKFLTQGDYQHVYYVDGKPKITDARIFCDGSAGAPATPNCVTGQGSGTSHPNGWGTILIGSFRLGGSCANCNTGGTDLSVTADWDYNSGTANTARTFRSAYFALDITDPELNPKLLWSFTDSGLGLSLGYPTMARLRPASGDKTTNSDARWFMVVGSGPTGYDVGSVQTANLYVVDIVKKATSNTLNTAFYKFPTIQTCGAASPNSECSVIGNVVTVDTDLDYRADVFYFGNMICNASASPCNGSTSPAWKGRFYRLTTGSSTNPALGTETDPCGWGVGSGCARTPSVLLDDFACSGACTGASQVGPVSAASNVTSDDANKIWVYWGTGRYFYNADKINTDIQHFFGVKDPAVTAGCTQSSATACEEKDLVNVSNAEICVIGTTTGSGTCTATNQVSNVTGADGFDSGSGASNTLQSLMQTKDGWYTTLDDQNAATTTRERSLSQPAIIGGIVFFPSFEPDNNICSSSGSSFLYALFYKSGTANKESVIGTVTQGSNTNVSRRQAIGDPGLASGVAVHMGAQGSGGNGSGGGGCQGQLTANIQSSTGSVGQTCMKTAGVPWSYYISWTSQRDS